MAIAEIPFNADLSRRQFLGLEKIDYILERRNRSRRGQPPRRPHLDSPLVQPEPPHRGGHRFTRREALILGGGLALGSVIAVVLKPWNWFISPESSVKYSEIESYYPQIKDYRVFNHGEFTTDYTHTKWFNLSRINFNPNTASAMFKYFEDLGRSQKLINYPYGQQSIPFALDKKPRTERVIFLVPQTAPSPNWPDIAYTASTSSYFANKPYVTFVRVPNTDQDIPPSQVFTTTELAVNKAFSVEACQSSLQISSLSPEIANIGQEIVCNSYGVALTLKQKGMQFRDYEIWAKSTTMRKDSSSPSSPLHVLGENEYISIPTVGMIIH